MPAFWCWRGDSPDATDGEIFFFFLLFICEQFVLPFNYGGEYSAYPRLGAPEPSAPSGEMGAGEPEGVGHKQSAIAQGQSEATTTVKKKHKKREYLV